MKENIKKISTEGINEFTKEIDNVTTSKILKLLNNEDKKVPLAVEKVIPEITKVVDEGVRVIKNGGRIIYFGAGTSGRLGVLDASEILPTYGNGNYFVGLIAGGKEALINPIENAEDSKELIIEDFKKIKANKKDLFIGIAASGRTPYVLSGIKYANKIGATSVIITTSSNSVIGKISKIKIEALTGPEPITGSTRMKSGTAQKLILNMISTAIMIKCGKVYSNWMVDLKPTNSKLYERSIQMIVDITSISYDAAKEVFEKANKNVKTAIVMIWKNIDEQGAKKLIEKNDGKIRGLDD